MATNIHFCFSLVVVNARARPTLLPVPPPGRWPAIPFGSSGLPGEPKGVRAACWRSARRSRSGQRGCRLCGGELARLERRQREPRLGDDIIARRGGLTARALKIDIY